MTTIKNPPQETDPDALTGPGGLSLRQVHELTLQSLERDRQRLPLAPPVPVSWWRRLLARLSTKHER